MTWLPANQPGDAAVPVPDRIRAARPTVESPYEGLIAAGNRRAARQYAAELRAEDARAEIPLLAAEINYPAVAAERQRLEAALADVKGRVKLWRVVFGGGALPPNLADQQMRAATALAEFHARAEARLPAVRAAGAAQVANIRAARRAELARLTRETLGDGATLEAASARNRRAAERSRGAVVARPAGAVEAEIEWHRAYAERLIGPQLAARLTPAELAVGARCKTGLAARKVLLAYARRGQPGRPGRSARDRQLGRNLGRPARATSGVTGLTW